MLLQTPRLRLRRFTMADLPRLLELESDPEVVRHTPMGKPLPPERTEERLHAVIAKEKEREPLGVWCAETKEGEFVGWFMLIKNEKNEQNEQQTAERDPELGFMLPRRQWGKGYATEAAKRLLEYGLYELGHSAVLATVSRGNEPSARVLEKLGFQRTGSRQEAAASGAGEITLDSFIFWA